MRKSTNVFSLLLVVMLPWFSAAGAQGQSDGVEGPGEAAPWSVEGKPTPSSRPEGPYRGRGRGVDDDWGNLEKSKRELRLRCQIHEVEELGRIYVQEPSGSPYWIQLPPEVKIRTNYRDHFDGRKKLTIEDLEAGQRLVVTLRRSDEEIVKVMVRPAKV